MRFQFSFLRAFIIWEELYRLTAKKVLYFFFKDTPAQRLLSSALCAILHQLFYRKPNVAGKLKHHIPKSHAVPTFLSDVSALWALFDEACKHKELGEVICVFDALDECEQEGMRILAENLDQLLQDIRPDGNSGVSIKFLMTTRGYPTILEQFSDVLSDIVYLSGDDKDEKDQIQAEIGLVLDYQLERLSQKKHFKTERKERVYDALKAKGSEQRTYLWLKLIFELLQGTFKTTTRDWEDIIDKPPSSVNKAYETLLMRVDDGDKEAVRIVLHLTMAARRPLTLCEMNLALNIRIRPEISDEESLELSTDDEFKQWLLHTCGFFVTIYDDRVYFIHQTAKEFLLRPHLENSKSDGGWYHSITDRNAERMIAESCIAYLGLKQFHQRAFQDRVSDIQGAQQEYEYLTEIADVHPATWWPDRGEIDSAYDRIFRDFKLLHYALGFWARHFRSCQYIDEATVVDVGDIFFDKYLELFATTSPGPPQWLLVTLDGDQYLDWHDESRRRYRDYILHEYTVPKVAAYYNHIRLFQHAIQQSVLRPTETGREADASNCGTTLLHLAMFKDCSTDFLRLLASHVNVNARDNNSGETALSMAACLGHRRDMDILLDHGANPKIADNDDYSPLSHIARHYLNASSPEKLGYLNIMDRLFSHGADANSKFAPEESRERPIEQPGSLLTAAAVSTVGLADMRKKLEAVVASRCGDMNPHVSSLARAIMCPGFDLFSEPAFLDAFDESFVKFLLDHGASVDLHNESGEFRTRTALQSAYRYPGKYLEVPSNDCVFLGIGFLLHAGASPLPLSPEPNRSWWELSEDFDMFKDKPASWMLLLKSLGYDPLSPPEDSTLSYQRSATLLHEAVQWYSSSADWVWLMLKRGEDIESRDEEGQTALHVACIGGLPEIVNFLLQQGADIDARNNNGQTPLHVAKNAQVVRSLCAAGADANARDNDGLTPLHTIYRNDCSAAAATLLESHADVSARDSRGRTPLHLACQYSGLDKWYPGQVEVLLHYNANIDAQDTEGTSPLHEACGHYFHELVKVLLAHHADIEARDARGRTPIHRICEPSEIDHKMYDPEEARRQTLELLLTYQANIEARDQQGRTPVHQTISPGWSCLLLEMLLEHQANIEARDVLGCTPLHVACRESQDDIVNMLLEHGANSDARDSAGNTPAHFACQSLCFDALDSILRHRPDLDLNAQNSSGKTPLDVIREIEGAPEDNIGLLMSEFQELLWRFGC